MKDFDSTGRLHRRGAVALVLALLLAACSASPPSADGWTDPTPSISQSPAAETMPPAMPNEWSAFISISPDEYGLAGDGWSAHQVRVWAEQYCELEGLTPCEGVADRAVPLCIEKWDCHPALLVKFDQGTAAFVAGGNSPAPQVIAVWHDESDPDLARYGGARSLLEAYLLTVGVCPDEGGGDPRGVTCPSP